MFAPLLRLLLSLLALMTGLAVPGVAAAQSCNRAPAEVARSEAGGQDASDSTAEAATIAAPGPRLCAALPAAANALPLPLIGNMPARAGFIVRVDRAHE